MRHLCSSSDHCRICKHRHRRSACGKCGNDRKTRLETFILDVSSTDAKDDGPSNNESRSSNQDTPSQMRDPFALQTQTKNAHHGMPQSLSSSSAPPPPQGNTDRNWQSYVQQQYQSLSTSFASRSSRPTNTSSGSITQGSPISSSARLSTDQQQFASAANNQLVNPRYSYYMNKRNEAAGDDRALASIFLDESQFSPTGQSSAAPQDHSPKGKFSRRLHQVRFVATDPPPSCNDVSLEPSITVRCIA